MAMTLGGHGGPMSEINVTPMIDVLLVLLIIFMIIVPVTPRGLDALVPQPPKNPQKEQDNSRTIVVQILYRGGSRPAYKINETDISEKDLLPQLTNIFSTRAERVMFVKGDPDLDFNSIAQVIDIGHEANVDHIGLITPKIEAGQ